MIIETAIVAGTYGTMGSIPYYQSLKHTNPAKYNWMLNAGLIVAAPIAAKVVRSNTSKKNQQLATALTKTARAGAAAVYIASLDGPLPFADVLAVSYFGVSAAMSWNDYFTD